MKYLLSLFLIFFITGCSLSQQPEKTVEKQTNKKQIDCESLSTDKEKYNCFHKKAHKGDIKAQSWLGYYLSEGIAVSKNIPLANEWFFKAANAGDLYSQRELGINYLEAEDYKNAIYWLEKAALRGDLIALREAGYLFDTGVEGIIEENKVKAFTFFKEGAKKDDAYSMYYLGYYYKRGWLVPQDYKKAMSWYEMAAVRDNGYAMAEIGYLYAKGLGVEVNHGLAYKWFLKAANKNDKYAMGWLGYLRENGLGIEKDFSKAVQWYKKSQNEYSQNRLKILKKEGIIE